MMYTINTTTNNVKWGDATTAPKKRMTKTNLQDWGNRNHMKQRYLQDVLIRMAYNSSGIEGNTISLAETGTIFLEGTMPSGRQSVQEFYEIINHKQTFSYMLDQLKDDTPLSLSMIKDFHRLLTDRLQHDSGQFKTEQNAIIGARFKTATPQETPQLMQQWTDNTTYRLDNTESEQAQLKILSDTHIQFEQIHPFSDGNGRTGRILLLHLSLHHLKAPIIINKDDRTPYIEALTNNDTHALTTILRTSIEYEKNRMTQFN